MEKQIKQIKKLQFEHGPSGFSSTSVTHSEYETEPFLVFGEFFMDRPVFGPHPHAGVSVMTYVLPDSQGSFLNRDSLGDHSIIEPGGIHITQAGKGIEHDEVPAVKGTRSHAFQIWINHADKDRLVKPKAFRASSKDVPKYITDKIHLRVVQGNYGGLNSTIELVTKTLIFDVALKPNTQIEFNAKEMSFIYLISGELIAGNDIVASPGIIKYQSQGDKITVRTGERPANFMFASGTPHNEPIVYGGPFVMTTQQQMFDTQLRLQRGEIGIIKP
ncbi:MAG: pirin family protein [Segetibacter sp.]